MESTRQTWLQYGDRLLLVREKHGLSQAKFAPKIGVHKNTLGHYERGARELGADALRSLVYMGWNANWLLTGEGPERLEDLAPDASQPVRPPDAPLDLDPLTDAWNIVNDVLIERGVRDQVDPDQLFELVRVVFQDLARGRAKAEASESLTRILAINKGVP